VKSYNDIQSVILEEYFSINNFQNRTLDDNEWGGYIEAVIIVRYMKSLGYNVTIYISLGTNIQIIKDTTVDNNIDSVNLYLLWENGHYDSVYI